MKLIFTLLCCFYFTALSWGTDSASKAVLNFRVNTEPPSVDWNKTMDTISTRVQMQIMEGLTGLGDDFSTVPGLANSWVLSKDRKTYIFHLRKKIFWSDGTELTAQHFVDSWERLLNPKNAAPSAHFIFDVVGAKEYHQGQLTEVSQLGFQAKDRYTLEVRLRDPADYFPAILSYPNTFPIRLDLLAKHGENWLKPENLVVLGPYRLTGWKHGVELIFERNEKYYGKAANIENVIFKVVNEDSVALSMFEKGMLDVAPNLPPLDLQRLRQNSSFKNYPWVRSYGYAFNVKKKPFDDVRVRQALAHAIDRKQITEMLGGGQVPIKSWVPPQLWVNGPEVGLSFDPARAKQLLSAAGYPGGQGFPAVTAYFDTRDDNRMVAERLQAVWKEVLGIQIAFQNEDWKTYLGHVRSDPPPLHKSAWGMVYPDPYDFLASYAEGGDSKSGWKNPEYDQLLKAAAREPGKKKRLEHYGRAQALLLEKETVVIPLFQETAPMMISSRVRGLRVLSGRYYLKTASFEK